jgi:hypothetical protein
MRALVMILLLATGCIHHWVPVAGPEEIRPGDTVRVESDDGRVVVVERGDGPFAFQPHARHSVRRVNGWATAGVTVGVTIVVFCLVVGALAAAAASVGSG